MKNESFHPQQVEQGSSPSKVDALAEKAEKVANSKWYKMSPFIAGVALAGVVVLGISKSVAEQRNDAPEKLDHSVSIVEN